MPLTERARPAQFDRANQHRRSMLAKIHVAKKQMALSDDDYRQILLDETGKGSAGDCTEGQLTRVIDRLKRQGFQPMPKAGAPKPANHPMARKARALWISLHQLGAVRNPSEQALEAFAKRQLGCERLNWARQSDAYRLIEALKAMAERHGWKQDDPATGQRRSPRQLQESLCELILTRLQKAGLAPDAWTLETAAFRLCGIELQPGSSGSLAEQFARLAAALGKELRQAEGA